MVANNADLMAHPYDTMLRVHTQLRECGEPPLHTHSWTDAMYTPLRAVDLSIGWTAPVVYMVWV